MEAREAVTNFDEYAGARGSTLNSLEVERLRRVLIDPFDVIYHQAISTLIDNLFVVERHALLLAHRHFYEAAFDICSGDAINSSMVTRRAIEVVVAIEAMRRDDNNVLEWLQKDKRLKNLERILEGKRPTPVIPRYGQSPSAAVNALKRFKDMISSRCHFSPEYFSELDFEISDARLELRYLCSNASILLKDLRGLVGVHQHILIVFDELAGNLLQQDKALQASRHEYFQNANAQFPSTAMPEALDALE